ncbi:MAG: hypothetical protein JO171_05625 [Paludibacterium sp.]|uniref:hypothetical protein n=1 Tax=Paludibacterium sp. TaxID=1917523 RepID=UPI0025D47593|nr:hypothetical protein [Paludibacterium sp.]MBV8046609.1 hypothetical protein [Paludibacterium sp.]MBV8648026.1 hypothetical protein [Paludibacterium sp.]
MPTLRLLADAVPIAFSCQLDCLRRQQVFWRSQWFYNGRTLCGAAPWSDKLWRMQQRWHADVLSLWYDCGEAHHRGYIRLAPGDDVWQPWLASVTHAQRLALDGLLELGRRQPFGHLAAGIDPERG